LLKELKKLLYNDINKKIGVIVIDIEKDKEDKPIE